jgi:lipoic acid synthetase
MLGLGETREEVLAALRDFRTAGVDIVTLGQYLQPTARHLAVQKYWHPDEFSELRDRALEMGFSRCVSGPLVRSSYHAGKHAAALKKSS